jgi:hypothetical protein
LVAGRDTAGVTILCEAAKTEVMMPKYTTWLNYEAFLAGNIERYCTYHTTGKQNRLLRAEGEATQNAELADGSLRRFAPRNDA